MPKPDFSDFYRFVASLGTILIGLAITAPWLMLRESFDTRISASELAELTIEAQALIALRQHYAYVATKYIAGVSLGIGILGFALLLIGLYLWWKRKQSVIDQRDLLELEKLKAEVPSLTPEQIAQKAIKEATEERMEVPPSPDTRVQPKQLKYYFEVEGIVKDMLRKCFGNDYLLTNRQITMYEYDAILLARDNRHSDLIIELKALRGPVAQRNVISDAVSRLSDSLSVYVNHTHRKSTGMVLAVTDLVADETNLTQANTAIEKEMSELTPHVAVRILTQDHLKQMSCAEFAALMNFDLTS